VDTLDKGNQTQLNAIIHTINAIELIKIWYLY